MPDNISYGSNRKVWWEGRCGHIWLASVKSRSSGENCPICSGARIVEGINDLNTTRPDLAAEWSPKNEPLKPTMVSTASHKKVIWYGKCGHEWSATVKSRSINGTGCPYCSHNIVLPGFNDLESQHPEVAAEWSERNLPLLPSMVTAYTNQKVWWKCDKGHEWKALVSTRSYGSKCPYCSGISLLKGFNDFATKQPLLASEWSEKNLPLTPDMVNEKSTKNVWWRCNTCGYEWKAQVKSRIKGVMCPVCSDRAVLAGFNDLGTTDPIIMREWDLEKNQGCSPDEVSRYSLRSVWWKCSKGHSWKAKIRDRVIDGMGCRVCDQQFHELLLQLLVMLYAEKKELKVLIGSEREVGIQLETYIPELRLALESTVINSKEAQNEADVREFICNKQGIKLLRVPLKRNIDEVEYAGEVKRAFQKAHIHIESDCIEDIAFLRRMFFAQN